MIHDDSVPLKNTDQTIDIFLDTDFFVHVMVFFYK